ncbi:BTB domain containing protein [Asbolus verrucosus]|uniref:BTB domain containing protein n=1 Tax=Asbolus verrucosus TaxID=1661398 RepID=A0A482VU00_ASBVE|nr:BTB domain containing protein [Asbolus verrucosus]
MEDATLNIVPYNNTYDKENFNYKDSFYVNFIDVQINCVGKLMGAHKFILANRSDYFKEILTKNPKIHQIEMAIPSKIVDRVFSLIYGQSITIKESELGDLARMSVLVQRKRQHNFRNQWIN